MLAALVGVDGLAGFLIAAAITLATWVAVRRGIVVRVRKDDTEPPAD